MHKTEYMDAKPMVRMFGASLLLFAVGRLLQVWDDNLAELPGDES